MPKYDINDLYVSEVSTYQTLVLAGANRSSLSGTYVSPSSGLSYTYTNESDLMTQLGVFLEPYRISASDYNSIIPEAKSLIGRYQSQFGFRNATYTNTELSSNIAILSTGQTTGTVIKTYTPSDLKLWGNIKFSKTTPTNTTITCDILDASDNVLKSNVTSVADLSDISIVSYPSIKIKWTLTRDVIGTSTPQLSNPSLTWEGESDDIFKIADVTLTGTTSQVNIPIPSGFSELDVSLFMKSSAGSYINIRFNGSATGYSRSQIASDSDTYAYNNVAASASEITLYNHRVLTDYSMAPAGSGTGFAKCSISNFPNSYKAVLARFRGQNTAITITEGTWANTTEINTLNIIGTNFTAGSRIMVRGMK